jgi:hypothetical protein
LSSAPGEQRLEQRVALSTIETHDAVGEQLIDEEHVAAGALVATYERMLGGEVARAERGLAVVTPVLIDARVEHVARGEVRDAFP